MENEKNTKKNCVTYLLKPNEGFISVAVPFFIHFKLHSLIFFLNNTHQITPNDSSLRRIHSFCNKLLAMLLWFLLLLLLLHFHFMFSVLLNSSLVFMYRKIAWAFLLCVKLAIFLQMEFFPVCLHLYNFQNTFCFHTIFIPNTFKQSKTQIFLAVDSAFFWIS